MSRKQKVWMAACVVGILFGLVGITQAYIEHRANQNLAKIEPYIQELMAHRKDPEKLAELSRQSPYDEIFLTWLLRSIHLSPQTDKSIAKEVALSSLISQSGHQLWLALQAFEEMVNGPSRAQIKVAKATGKKHLLQDVQLDLSASLRGAFAKCRSKLTAFYDDPPWYWTASYEAAFPEKTPACSSLERIAKHELNAIQDPTD